VPESPDPQPEPVAPRTFPPLSGGRLTVLLLALAFLALALAAGLTSVLVDSQAPGHGAPSAAADAKAHVL